LDIELPDVEHEIEIPKKAVRLPKKPEMSINMPKAAAKVQVPKKPDVSLSMPKKEMKMPSPPMVKMQAPVNKAPRYEPKLEFEQQIEIQEIPNI